MENLLNIRQASDVLNLKIKTIYMYVHQRKIPFIKIGSRVLFDPLRLQQWLKDHQIEPINQ